ncbi:MAG TPA: hypothetical protein VH371_10815 [Candidatus Limnocylindrales bacterium]|jgi:hypothetical protein
MNRINARRQNVAHGLDTEGHRLVVLDRPGQRKPVRVAELQQELRLRRQLKESRSNRPERY